MRIIYVLVSADVRQAALDALDDRDVAYTVLDADDPTGRDRDCRLVQAPVPTDAVRPTLEALVEAGVDVDRYVVVASGQTAATPTWRELEDRFADDYDPLPRRELRSKAMDLSQDRRSFYALMVASALIATVGLLADSPAIVVGSMVIAPVVGPVLTASVGAVLGDRRMMLSSLRLQAGGLALAVLVAFGLSLALRWLALAPPVLAVSSIELIGVRLAPNVIALTVALGAGAAAGIGVTTKGPMSLIGVMIAAALLPAAAAAGIGFAWGEPLVGIGTLALVTFTVVTIDAAVAATLWVLGYRPDAETTELASVPGGVLANADRRQLLAVGVVGALFAAAAVGTVAVTADQMAFERAANQAAVDAVEDPTRENLTVVAVRSQYASTAPVDTPETVTVVVSDARSGNHSGLDEDIAARIADRTGERVAVRVRFVEYQSATARPGRAATAAERQSRLATDYPSKGSSGS
ncbi:uncharacterized hydrophobic domain-containing protein [Natronoarchaeum philippinense]|uniref:Uncharacterized hydrophobic domain-containing protein n=1 Tax=Natronoarchaeum philippinense TaxID=558529 RepID=A0A285NR26_NATPI|nr:DUF389 domain-containing protein [Natronoarchaeum philippinense]SNZ11899.1 uncharacterized hydrophobic domain-containing protein [Natronoarchaeum philippinense]